MTTIHKLLVAVFLVQIFCWGGTTTNGGFVVHAFPAGAGACPAGVPAVGNPHVGGGRPETTGELIDGGFVVLLNNVPLEGKPVAIRVGELNDIQIITSATLTTTTTTTEDGGIEADATEEEDPTTTTSMPVTAFKGFLIRVGPPPGVQNAVDLRDALYPVASNDTTTQIASTTCVDVELVGGLTHTSADPKTSIVGTLLVEQAVEELSIDVTGTYYCHR